MSSAEALLERNTDSVVFMDALPALHRAAQIDEKAKSIFLGMCQYWLTDNDRRSHADRPHAVLVLAFLKMAQEQQMNKKESDALNVLVTTWHQFAPAEYLNGCY